MSTICSTVVPLTGHVDRNRCHAAIAARSYGSCPSRGTWIEIAPAAPVGPVGPWSCPSRGTWIEILVMPNLVFSPESCPSRGTWIEISLLIKMLRASPVVPLTGHVDRNQFPNSRKPDHIQSCPSRGTWIEISPRPHSGRAAKVVPLTGHVDRNITGVCEVRLMRVVPLTGHVDRNVSQERNGPYMSESCPSRGTWIEIPAPRMRRFPPSVVPLTGHVDRNVSQERNGPYMSGRAPHGARG